MAGPWVKKVQLFPGDIPAGGGDRLTQEIRVNLTLWLWSAARAGMMGTPPASFTLSAKGLSDTSPRVTPTSLTPAWFSPSAPTSRNAVLNVSR